MAQTYKKALRNVRFTTLNNIAGWTSDTEATPSATNAISAFERKKTIEVAVNSGTTLIPFHAVKRVERGIYTVDAISGDKYGCGKKTVTKIWEGEASFTYQQMVSFYVANMETSEWTPSAGDEIIVHTSDPNTTFSGKLTYTAGSWGFYLGEGVGELGYVAFGATETSPSASTSCYVRTGNEPSFSITKIERVTIE